MLFAQLLINGIQVGALFALTAAGFSLIFGSTKIFHFAHGAAFTIAAYLFYELFAVSGTHWIISALIAALAHSGTARRTTVRDVHGRDASCAEKAGRQSQRGGAQGYRWYCNPHRMIHLTSRAHASAHGLLVIYRRFAPAPLTQSAGFT